MHLLEAFPAFSWLGILTSVALGFLGFLLKDSYSELKSKVKNLGIEVELLQRQQNDFERDTNERIHNLHLTILQKLDEIKDKYNQFRN